MPVRFIPKREKGDPGYQSLLGEELAKGRTRDEQLVALALALDRKSDEIRELAEAVMLLSKDVQTIKGRLDGPKERERIEDQRAEA
jgi:hypothetical protein